MAAMSERPHLSVVIPFFNEEGNVLPLFEELVPCFERIEGEVEVVAVNDGSRDRTHEELEEAVRRWPCIRYYAMQENAGQTAAFDAGFKRARGVLVATMDGDRQIDPADLPEMVALLEKEQVDFVYGWRKDRRDSLVKRVSTKVANGVRNWLTKESIPDTGCPLKVFRREVLAGMKLFNGMHRFFITLGHLDGYRSAQMVVRHRARMVGESKYGVWNRVFRALRDCLTVRWMQKRALRYDCREVPSGVTRSGASGATGEAAEHG